MKTSVRKTLLAALFFSLIVPSFASETASAAYLEGCTAFYRGEWESSVFLLKKAVSYPENNTADVNYMLITAQIYAGNNADALSDCERFLKAYPKSIYIPRIQYTQGKLLYSLGNYEKAIVILSDFCHKNEKNDLYPSALFYIAESLYAGYKFDEAESIYEKIVANYPDNNKVAAAQYRLESIAQRSREEKLLYLLKQTGEEYLAAKEDYEKQLKYSSTDSASNARERLMNAQSKNQELEDQIADLERQIAKLKAEQVDKDNQIQKMIEDEEKMKIEKVDSIRKLKEKALVVQDLIDEK